jgi:oxygen-dependent protoporphyrinogen oxidase
MFLRLRGGLRRLTDGLAEAIGRERIRCGTTVEEVVPGARGFEVRAGGRILEAGTVVFACPAPVTADLIGSLAPQAARGIRAIRHVSTAVVLLVYPEGTASALPEASGFVAPRGRLAMTACTFVSRKWPDPAFGDRAVLRCFVGADGLEEGLDQPDDELVERVALEASALLPLPPDPSASRVVRWPRSMPQYDVGHVDRVAAIERALPSGVHVVGPAYRGAGIPDCVRQATELAERLAAANRDALQVGRS